tara:strand:+ start:713 stop:862 length:150 start_codon:yes stop_codon:yes gene_type:complete
MNKIKLKNKIAKYEEQISWLKEILKQTEDSLFCAKVEIKGLNNDNQSSS